MLLVNVINTSSNYIGIIEQMSKFANWIQRQMDARDMTQADLCRASGLTTAGLSNLMTKVGQEPSVDTCRKLSKAFKINIKYVFEAAGYLPESKPEAPDKQELNFMYDQMDDFTQKLVLGMVRGVYDQHKKA